MRPNTPVPPQVDASVNASVVWTPGTFRTSVASGLKPGETIYGSWDDKYRKYEFIVDGKKMFLTIGELIELLLDEGKTLDDVVISQPPKKSPAILVKSRPNARKKQKLFVEPYKADDSWKVAVAERMVQVAAEQEEELMMILALL